MEEGFARLFAFAIQDHEMAAVPVKDAGERLLGQYLLQRNLHAERSESQRFGRIRNGL